MIKIAIATPTYNEAKNIPLLIAELEKACRDVDDTDFTLFVVDDSSPDGTAEAAVTAAKKVKAKNFRVKLMSRQQKEGVGRAYIYAFKELLKQGFDYIIQIDADFSHNPDYLLILPWFFRDTFIEREHEYLRKGGTMIFPAPDFSTYSLKS